MPKQCKNCPNTFPYEKEIDGKVRNLQNRKYCLECSPFGEHNVKRLHEEDDKNYGKCKFCNREFEVDRSKGHRSNRCGTCRNRITHIRRKLKLIEESNHTGCKFCGYSNCKSALEFHHKGEKRYTVGQNIGSKSYDGLVEEIKNCVLLCSNCHEEHHTEETDLSCKCGDCKSCKQRERRHRRKRKAMEMKGYFCEDCGYEFREMASASFHHINPDEKEFNLAGNNFARSWNSIESEVEKCKLLCENCHRIRHCKGSEFCEHNTGRFSDLGLS